MNATRWVTLTGFVLYLGKTGKCKVEETPKGWYLQYIERDPELLEKQEKLAKKQQMELNDEERMQMEIEKRLQLAKQQAVSSSITPEATELKRDDNSDFKISFSLATAKKTEASTTTTTTSPKEEEIETVDYNPEEGEELDELDENSPPESDLPTSPEQVVPSEPKGTQKVEEKPVEKVQSSIEQIPTRESSIKKREKPETPRPEKEEYASITLFTHGVTQNIHEKEEDDCHGRDSTSGRTEEGIQKSEGLLADRKHCCQGD